MSTTLLSNGALLVDDELRSQAESVVAAAHDRQLGGAEVVLRDGNRIELGAGLAQFLVDVLERLDQGAVTVMTLPDELTTTTAADVLGVSRPTLMTFVRSGELRSKKVGTHTRLATADVLAFKSAREARRARSFEALRELDDEIGDLA